jgi:hypothetical protein
MSRRPKARSVAVVISFLGTVLGVSLVYRSTTFDQLLASVSLAFSCAAINIFLAVGLKEES